MVFTKSWLVSPNIVFLHIDRSEKPSNKQKEQKLGFSASFFPLTFWQAAVVSENFPLQYAEVVKPQSHKEIGVRNPKISFFRAGVYILPQKLVFYKPPFEGIVFFINREG